MKPKKPSCVDCGIMNCRTLTKHWPDFCLTTNLEDGELESVLELYEEPENNRLVLASAMTEY